MPELKLSNLTRLILGLIFSVGGGIAFVLAFPPYEIWPLALAGMVFFTFGGKWLERKAAAKQISI